MQVTVAVINGFSAQVNISISGAPVGVTATPATFTLSAAGQQTVTLTAAANAVPGNSTLSIAGASGALNHTSHLALGVDSLASGMHPPFRTRYLRTDAQWSYGFLNFFPQQWIIYDPGTRRFFANNSALNRIDVFDAGSELQIAQIPIPGPWVSDETPDHSTIYVGTLLGDLYAIDPVAMAVTKRIPSVQIGPTGFQAYEVRVLADGRLVLLGGTGGIPFVDGYASLEVWNPADNSATVLRGTDPGDPIICDQLGAIAEMTLNAPRTKVLISSADSDGTLCLVDPDTVTYRAMPLGGFLPPALIPPNGNAVILASGATVDIFDAQGLFLTDHFQVGDGTGFYRYVLSFDGNTLFAIPIFGSVALAYDWRTHAQKGWLAAFTTKDLESWTTPQVADETGLIAGVIGNGVSFLEGGTLLSSAPGLQVPNPSVQPTSGPPTGGTQTLVISDVSASRLSQIFFGTGLAEGATVDSLGVHVDSPPGNPGPVDVGVTATDGAIELSPEAFSYGPWIIEATPNSSTAEGGGTATIYGYGFGSFGQGQQAPGLQVSIGGQPATILQYLPTLATAQLDPYYPFPIEGIEVTVPPGTAGSRADITVSNPEGSYTAKNAFTYLPAIQQFSLNGAALAQGIYDSHRDVYYFTDQAQVRVFSRSQSQWLSSIPIANASRLWGIALSPDGSKLAIADAGARSVYLLDPNSPSSIKTFVLPNIGMDQGEQPSSLAITDSGIVYYSSFYIDTTGGWALHKLDTNTGNVIDYQWLQAGALSADAYARVLLSQDNTRVYINDGGLPLTLDTATDTPYYNPLMLLSGDYEMTLSSNGTSMSASEFLSDTNLNPESYIAYAEREVWNVFAVFGEKMSPDGNLLFSPLENAIDVIDGKRGNLLTRISLPIALSANYDALVADGQDNVLVAITGQAGTGIAVIDLTSVPEPPPLPYVNAATTVRMAVFPGYPTNAAHDRQHRSARRADAAEPTRQRMQLKHVTNNLISSRPSH
ncbi:MAG: IPT/TIG domain-containing protein [Acidobacteriia bacterium]|nr:IPT/TIG domain-containing protein [Terriglobia bacterium]